MFVLDYLRGFAKKKQDDYLKSDEATQQTDLRLIQDAFALLDRNRGKFNDLRRIYEAKFPPQTEEDLKRAKRSSIFVPIARDCVDAISGQFSAAFFTGRQAIEITGDNKIQIANLNRKIGKMLEKSSPTIAFNQAFKQALIYGFGCLRMTFDPILKVPKFFAVPIDAFALDHRAVNLADSQYYCYRVSMSFDRVVKVFGKKIEQVYTPNDPYQRVEIRQIYHKKTSEAKGQAPFAYYEVRTYFNRTLLHEDVILQLPFFFGFAVPKVPDLITNFDIIDEVGYFGVSLVELARSAQNEINKKRNQKIDNDEFQMNPKILYNEGFPLEAASAGAGTVHRVEGNLDQMYREMKPSGSISVERDIDTLKSELMQNLGVSSINFGVTGASDRRSASALEVIEASSGVRVENMIVTICDTLFQNAARAYIDMLRMKSLDPEFAFLDPRYMKVNFGTTTQTARRTQQLMNVLQIESQTPNANQQVLNDARKELMVLLMGNEYDASKLESSPESYGGI